MEDYLTTFNREPFIYYLTVVLEKIEYLFSPVEKHIIYAEM